MVFSGGVWVLEFMKMWKIWNVWMVLEIVVVERFRISGNFGKPNSCLFICSTSFCAVAKLTVYRAFNMIKKNFKFCVNLER